MRLVPLLVAAVTAAVVAVPASAAPIPAVQHLTFTLQIGAGTNTTNCKVVADLYTPDGASKENPAPAVLATNGFGRSKDDLKALGEAYRERGYVFLAYSGIGFGGSGCKIQLDDPTYDGRVGRALVSFLAGSFKSLEHVGVDYVIHDATDHAGNARTDDPRVGMIGGSYGGEIQFAVAGFDPRVDAIVPQITWNDLSYSLAPNNTSQTSGVTYATPGVAKKSWIDLFFADGIAAGVQHAQDDPTRNAPPCPNFRDAACVAKAQLDATGAPDAATLGLARGASVSSYIRNIKIPTLLAQGEVDTLFNLNEAVATYDQLRSQGTPVKMLWRSSGHSGGDLGASENNEANPEAGYESRTELEWLDYYLRGVGDPPVLDFSYFRDWVSFPAGQDAAAAVASAPSYPAAPARNWYLSGTNALVTDASAVKAGSAQFAVSPAPTSASDAPSVIPDPPITDGPGTFAAFTSAPLTEDTDVVGIPTVTVSLTAPVHAVSQADPAGKLVLFAKLYEIKKDGTVVLPNRLISPVRVTDVTKPVTIALPGIAHRFAKDSRLQFVLASSDAAYKNNNVSGPVTVNVDPKAPSVLSIPTLPASAATAPPDTAVPEAPAPVPAPAGSQSPGAGQSPAVAAEGQKTKAASLSPTRACKKNRRVVVVRFARIRKPDRVVSRQVTVNGKRIRVGHGSTVRIDLRKKRAGVYRISVVVKSKKGKVRRSARTYTVC